MIESSTLLELYRAMVRIRMVEESIADAYADQEMRCPVHLSIGQEAPSAAFSLVVEANDLAVSSHRGHAHYLAKGGDLGRMINALNQQEEQAKERISKYIENQEKITTAEVPTPREEEIEDIKKDIRSSGEREIPSRLIGEVVMQNLRKIDEVAFIRFASVYRRFEDINEFSEEVEKLTSD